MKSLNKKQIEQIKSLEPWGSTKFHGNTKTIGSLPVSVLTKIIEKKQLRERLRCETDLPTNIQLVKSCLKNSLERKNTPYFKIMIEGDTGIYYASVQYGHSDYNKTRLFDKNEQTLRLMSIFKVPYCKMIKIPKSFFKHEKQK